MQTHYPTFRDFYPAYLDEHRDPFCRRFHFVGTLLVLLTLATALITQRWWMLAVAPILGYGFAWVGHFVFEKNKPATFKHPLYSLMGDFVMFKDMLTGRVRF